jgi:ABC-type phosphate/phosphonate transport system substrate-binding protein
MKRTLTRGFAIVGLAGAFVCLLPSNVSAEKTPSGKSAVQIGMVNSLFRNTPENLLASMMQPFRVLMESQTGLSGTIIPGGDALQLGQKLMDGQVQLGVFHGIEFAWAREQHPQLRPLMIVVNKQPHVQALLVTSQNSPAKSLADLKGKNLAIAKFTRHHCYLFLERRCAEMQCTPEVFFARQSEPESAEQALDEIVNGKIEAALVDSLALECYTWLKPGACKQIRTLEKSPMLPAGVVAYRPGLVDEGTLERFRQGMVNANKTTIGKHLLTLWRLTGFEAVPADFDQMLAQGIKSYPPPLANGRTNVFKTTSKPAGAREKD